MRRDCRAVILPAMHQLELTFHGRVQGVGFRAFVLRHARERGLRGEVRNLPDGGVHVWAEGDEAVLDQFLEDVRSGPALARIEHLDERRDHGAARFRGFHITG